MSNPREQLTYARLYDRVYRRVPQLDHTTPPSKSRFRFAKILAATGDFLDIMETILVFTGIGIPITAGLEVLEVLIFDIPLLLLVGARNNKDKEKKIESITRSIDTLRAQTNSYRRTYAGFLRFARSNSILRRPVTKVALKFSAIRASLRRSPLGRTLGRIGLDKIPIINLWPWRYVGVRKAELEAWKAYNLVHEAHAEHQAHLAELDAIEEALAYASTYTEESPANQDEAIYRHDQELPYAA